MDTKRDCETRIKEKDDWVTDMQRQLTEREEDMKNLLNGKLKEGLRKQEEFAAKIRQEFQSA